MTKRRPTLAMNEVAFLVTVTIPTTWGKVQAARLELTMPEPPAALVRAAEAQAAKA